MKKNFKTIVGSVLLLILFPILFGIINGCSGESGTTSPETELQAEVKTDASEVVSEIGRMYPMPWKEPNSDELLSIGRAFVKAGTGGCGAYYLRASSENEDEYLVACTSDGINWEYYMVWPLIKEVVPFDDKAQPVTAPEWK